MKLYVLAGLCLLSINPVVHAKDNAPSTESVAAGISPDMPSVQDLDAEVQRLVSEAANNTEVDPNIVAASRRRNAEAAREMAMESRIKSKLRGKPSELSALAISQILTVDSHQPKLHLRALQLAHQRIKSTPNADPALTEFAWQEIEFLRLTQAKHDHLPAANQIGNSLATRVSRPSAKLMGRAANTFQTGLPVYLQYQGQEPIEIRGDDFERFELPLEYVRSPSFLPYGCRIVAKLVVKNKGRDLLLTHRTGYQPCAFLLGGLQGEFYSMGQFDVDNEVRLFVYATTLFHDSESPEVPISNIITIPVVVPAKPGLAQTKFDESGSSSSPVQSQPEQPNEPAENTLQPTNAGLPKLIIEHAAVHP